MAIIENKYRVEINHIGTSNLISNIGILSLLEDVGCYHSDLVGFGINDIPTTKLSWVLLQWNVKVIKRCKYASNLTIRTWAKRVNPIMTYRDFEVLDECGNLICIASSKWALVDIDKGKITKITDEVLDKYAPEEKNILDTLDFDKLKEPESNLSEYIYKVQRRDIDINNHMHNLYYLSLAYETLPEDIYNSEEFNNIEIMYKKGIKLGNTVKCLYSFENNTHFVTIKSEDEKFLHAIIKLY